MKNKIYALWMMITMILVLVSCGAEDKRMEEVSDPLEGYWMFTDGSGMSFDGNGLIVQDGVNGTYSIYDANKVAIIFSDISYNFEFLIEEEKLYLTDLADGITYMAEGNEEKQEEIRKVISAYNQAYIEEQEELARIQGEETARLKRIEEIEKELRKCDVEIDVLNTSVLTEENSISDCELWMQEYPEDTDQYMAWIAESKDLIEQWKQEINDYEERKVGLEEELERLRNK